MCTCFQGKYCVRIKCWDCACKHLGEFVALNTITQEKRSDVLLEVARSLRTEANTGYPWHQALADGLVFIVEKNFVDQNLPDNARKLREAWKKERVVPSLAVVRVRVTKAEPLAALNEFMEECPSTILVDKVRSYGKDVMRIPAEEILKEAWTLKETNK